MTEDVLITVSGRQTDIEEAGRTELMCPGRYYFRNNKHYLLYDEPDPEDGTVKSNNIKISGHVVEIIRKGPVSTRLLFDEGRRYVTDYATPMGMMVMDTSTRRVTVREEENRILAEIDYDLTMNDTFISRSIVEIEAASRGITPFHLL